jgi:hypothetical protein
VEALAAMVGQEGGAAEQQDEQLEGVSTPGGVVGEGLGALVEEVEIAAGTAERLAEVDFQEVLGDGEGSAEIEPPMAAVGEDAPAEVAFRDVSDPTQVAEHLRRGHAFFRLPPGLLAVEHAVPALGLDDAQAVLEALPGAQGGGLGLRLGAPEEEGVGHVLPGGGRQVLLHGQIGPAHRLQNGVDQFLLGLSLRGVLEPGQPRKQRLEGVSLGLDRRLLQRGPGRRLADALEQEVAGEQIAVEQGTLARGLRHRLSSRAETLQPRPEADAWRRAFEAEVVRLERAG